MGTYCLTAARVGGRESGAVLNYKPLNLM